MCNMLQKIDKQNTIPKSLHISRYRYVRSGQFHARGIAGFWLQHNILQGDGGETKMTGALPIFGEHRIALRLLWSACKLLYYCRTKIAPPYITGTLSGGIY